MKKYISLILFLGICLFAQMPEVAKVSRNYHKHSKEYGKGAYFELKRQTQSYLLYFQWVNATQKSEEQVLIGLPEPHFWNGFRRRGWFDLVVNGIASSELEPKDIQTYTEGNCAGVKAIYNFNGCKMWMKVFMDDKSPLLHVEWLPFNADEKLPAGVQMKMSLAPNVDGMKNNSYKRELKTPARTYARDKGKSGWTNIQPDDTSFVMYDTVYIPAEDKQKINSPSFFKMDPAQLAKGRFYYGAASGVSFDLTFKEGLDAISFQCLDVKRKMNTEQFLQFLQDNNCLQ